MTTPPEQLHPLNTNPEFQHQRVALGVRDLKMIIGNHFPSDAELWRTARLVFAPFFEFGKKDVDRFLPVILVGNTDKSATLDIQFQLVENDKPGFKYKIIPKVSGDEQEGVDIKYRSIDVLVAAPPDYSKGKGVSFELCQEIGIIPTYSAVFVIGVTGPSDSSEKHRVTVKHSRNIHPYYAYAFNEDGSLNPLSEEI